MSESKRERKSHPVRAFALRSSSRGVREFFFVTILVATLTAPFSAFAVGVDKLVSDVCKKSTDAAFREKYCKAAEEGKKGFVANKATAAVWGGVSVVCAAACGNAFGAAGLACKVSQSAGGVAEGAVTKKFISSLVGEGNSYAKDLSKGAAKAEVETEATSSKLDSSACITAGTTALKSYEKIANSKLNVKNLSELREQTQAMNTAKGDATAFAVTTEMGIASKDGTKNSGNEYCTEAALTSALGSIRCASQADPSLPSYVKSENFLKDLAKASGKSPDEFFKAFESPAKSLSDSPTLASLSESGKSGTAEALSAMEKLALKKTFGDLGDGYRMGSARKLNSGEDDAGFDVNGAIADALNGLKEQPEEQKLSGVDSITAGSRSPASGREITPEDRSVSIFDRVMWRYGAISARDHLGLESDKREGVR